MSANLSGFNAGEIEPSLGFEIIPGGDYVAVIVESEIKATRAGDGSYLALTFQILEGSAKGRKLWANLNLENKNPTAVNIAKAELSAICRAVGILTPKDSAELHNKPLTLKVGVKPDQNGEERNVIRAYKALSATSGQTVPAQSAKAVAPTEKAPETRTAGSRAPWLKS